MEQSPIPPTLYRCDSCGSIALGHRKMECCMAPMEPVGSTDFDINYPALEDVVRMVFGMSTTELDICLCVMEDGETTINDLAERVEYDRSVVSRHLTHLENLGVIEKRRLLRKDGGQVYVYSPNDPAVVRQNLTAAFLSWVLDATGLINSLTQDKVKAIANNDAPGSEWKIYKE